jgi:MerR family transcriptional regulator, light-induced transcriptional regulator
VDSHESLRSRLPGAVPQGAGLAILRAIGRHSRTVSEIVELTGLSQPNVSNHLARFRERRWVQAERSGRSVRYRLADPALSAYLEQHARAGRVLSQPERDHLLEEARSAYTRASTLVQPEMAEQVIDEVMNEGVTWQEVYLHVLSPALKRVGELWQSGALSVAAEHAATVMTQRILSRTVPRPFLADRAPLGTVVVGCVAGEHHSLGARMVADFFQASGWSVRLLGADVPTGDLVDFVRLSRPDLVALSATVDEAEEALGGAVRELLRSREDSQHPLLIGGGQWFDRHPAHGLPLDLCGSDLPAIVAQAGRYLGLGEE